MKKNKMVERREKKRKMGKEEQEKKREEKEEKIQRESGQSEMMVVEESGGKAVEGKEEEVVEGREEEVEVLRSKFEDEEIRRTYQITYQSRFKAVLSFRKRRQLGNGSLEKKKKTNGEQMQIVNVQLEPVDQIITTHQEKESSGKENGSGKREGSGLEQEWRDGLIARLCENCEGAEEGVQSLVVWWGLCVWRGYTVHYKDLPDLEAADLYNHLISSQGRRFDAQGNPDSWWIMEVPVSYLYFSYFTEMSILSLKYPSLIPLQCKEFTRQFPSVFGFKSLLRNNKGVVNHVQHKIQQNGEKTMQGNVKRSTLYYVILPPLHQARCDFITRYPDKKKTFLQITHTGIEMNGINEMGGVSGVGGVSGMGRRGIQEYFAWCPSPPPFTPFPFQYSLLAWTRSQCDTMPSSILKSSSATNTSLCRQITHFTQNLPLLPPLLQHALPNPTYSNMTPPILPEELGQGQGQEQGQGQGQREGVGEWGMTGFASGEQSVMEQGQNQEEQIQAMLEQFIAHHGPYFEAPLSTADNDEMRMDSFFSQDASFFGTSSTATTPAQEDQDETSFSFS